MKDKESGRNLDQAGIMSLYPTYIEIYRGIARFFLR